MSIYKQVISVVILTLVAAVMLMALVAIVIHIGFVIYDAWKNRKNDTESR